MAKQFQKPVSIWNNTFISGDCDLRKPNPATRTWGNTWRRSGLVWRDMDLTTIHCWRLFIQKWCFSCGKTHPGSHLFSWKWMHSWADHKTLVCNVFLNGKLASMTSMYLSPSLLSSRYFVMCSSCLSENIFCYFGYRNIWVIVTKKTLPKTMTVSGAHCVFMS